MGRGAALSSDLAALLFSPRAVAAARSETEPARDEFRSSAWPALSLSLSPQSTHLKIAVSGTALTPDITAVKGPFARFGTCSDAPGGPTDGPMREHTTRGQPAGRPGLVVTLCRHPVLVHGVAQRPTRARVR